jgi:hypothetical protein
LASRWRSLMTCVEDHRPPAAVATLRSFRTAAARFADSPIPAERPGLAGIHCWELVAPHVSAGPRFWGGVRRHDASRSPYGGPWWVSRLEGYPSAPCLKRISGLSTRLLAHMLYLGNTSAHAFVRLTKGHRIGGSVGRACSWFERPIGISVSTACAGSSCLVVFEPTFAGLREGEPVPHNCL